MANTFCQNVYQPSNQFQLLWTDPQEAEGRGPSKRGVGVGFGPDVTKRWCELNKVTAVIRSHEVRQEGYAIEHGESLMVV